jgi:hypothetical protein
MSRNPSVKKSEGSNVNEAALVLEVKAGDGLHSGKLPKAYQPPHLYRLAELLDVTLGGSPGPVDSGGQGCFPDEECS